MIVDFRIFQRLEEYAATLKECIDECKYKVVILIDSLDDISELEDLSWFPNQVNEHVKVVITISWDIDDVSKCASQSVLGSLRDQLSKESFIQLQQYSGEKWDEIMTAGNDCSYANPTLWRDCTEKSPIQAKASRFSLQLIR